MSEHGGLTMQPDGTREDVTFETSDGTTLAGWLYHLTASDTPRVVVMAHGYGAVKEMYLDLIAERIAAAGLFVLVYDHRGLGASEGAVRGELDPQQQIADYRDAITFALTRTGATRAGIWGSSFCGGHVQVLGATDARVGAVWAQIPTISGSENLRRRIPGDDRPGWNNRLARDRVRRMAGGEPERVPLVNTGQHEAREPGQPVGNDEALWMSTIERDRLAGWENSRTVRSVELYGAYEPGTWMAKISPTPLTVVCLDRDTVVNADLVLEAYNGAREPKELILLPGGHFDAYGVHRDELADRAAHFFAAALS